MPVADNGNGVLVDIILSHHIAIAGTLTMHAFGPQNVQMVHGTFNVLYSCNVNVDSTQSL